MKYAFTITIDMNDKSSAEIKNEMLMQNMSIQDFFSAVAQALYEYFLDEFGTDENTQTSYSFTCEE